MTFKTLISLQFSYKDFDFEENFKKFSSLIKKSPNNSIIVAPELSLTNFCYENLNSAYEFSKSVEKEIAKLSNSKLIAVTVIEKVKDNFYNRAKVFYNEKLIFQRDKYELFKFGDEHKYFKAGKKEDIKIFEIAGVKFALLICFELRFIDLWEKIRGADVVLIPSLWGKLRKNHLEILSNALSLANQCFVIVSNSANEDMAKSSSISNPFGEFYKDDRKSLLQCSFERKLITKMRRYLDVGIN